MGAHIYFTDVLDDRLLYQLKSSYAKPFVKTLSDIPIDFFPLEERVATLKLPNCLQNIYGVDSEKDKISDECSKIAKKISSYWILRQSFPIIRYHKINYCHIIAQNVYQELEAYRRIHENHFQMHLNPPTCLILDRAIDLISPLVWDFNYQGMANDLVGLKESGRKYLFRSKDKSKYRAGGEMILDDSTDSVWKTTRHYHIAKASEALAENLKDLRNKVDSSAKNDSGSIAEPAKGNEISNLHHVLAQLPDIQFAKHLLAGHINLAQDCIQEMEKRKIMDFASFGQDLACGETINGKDIDNPEKQLLHFLNRTDIRAEDRTRLLILFCLSYDGFDEKNINELLGKIPTSLLDSINGLKQFGIPVYRPKDLPKRVTSGKKSKEISADGIDLTVCRYKPKLDKILQSIKSNALDEATFPCIQSLEQFRKAFVASNTHNIASSRINTTEYDTESLSSMEIHWNQRKKAKKIASELLMKEDSGTGVRTEDGKSECCVCIIGGGTFLESKILYDLYKENRDPYFLIVTSMSVGECFLDQLRHLRPRRRRP